MRKKRERKLKAKIQAPVVDRKKAVLEMAKDALSREGISLVGVAFLGAEEAVVLVNCRPAHLFGALPLLSGLASQQAQAQGAVPPAPQQRQVQ